MKKVFYKILAIVAAFAAGTLCVCGAFGCDRKEELTVYTPDGAPALALAKLMAEDTADDGVRYTVVTTAGNANGIAAKVTNKDEDKNADLCVLPLTAASKHLGDGARYTMLGTVTHGNLYLLSKNQERVDDLSALVGKTVGVIQINEVPGLTLKALLTRENIAYQAMQEGEKAADKVNLLPLSDPTAVGVPYEYDGTTPFYHDYYLVAEPAASFQASKKGYALVGDLQALYGGENGYPQAVLVAKNSIVEKRAAWVRDFVGKIENSGAWLRAASGESLVAAVSAHMETGAATSLKAPLLTADAVARCGVYFTYAKAGIDETEGFLAALRAVNPQAAAPPAPKFFWEYTK